MSAPHSLRWRLPLLVCGLVALVLVTFLWAAYRRVEATLAFAAGERAQAAANQIANTIDGPRTIEQLRQLGADSTLRRFLRLRTDEAREAAHARLRPLMGASLRRIEVRDAAGSLLFEVSRPGSPIPGSVEKELPRASGPFVPGIGPLRQSEGIVFMDTVAEIRDDESGPLGLVVIRSTFSENPPGIFNRLVGNDAIVRVANRTGDIWGSFTGVVPSLPVDLTRTGVAQYRTESGETRLGAVSHIRATPWAVWVEFPFAVVIAPARLFLKQMIPVAIIFLAAGGVIGSLLSGRVTRPLSELTHAAEAIATGDYSRRVVQDRRDEIGRLGRTFNAMAGQVQEAQQRLEARVVERTARLEAANAELEAFSYSVSHDLRAPLRSIDGFSQALSEDAADRLNTKEKGYLQRVRAAAQRMGELIDDLLELSRVGRAELHRERVSLSEIGHAVASDLKRSTPDRQVQLDIQGNLVAEGDCRLVRIVIENLLGNAWKFTRNVVPARIELGAEPSDDDIAYFVRDNGAGFDMTYMDKLFRPFQRLHGEAEFPGTGIGLATVRRIVDRHGGRAWATGAVGAGATVYFTLPHSRMQELI
jgi:signal transduction histidine kinase